MIERNIFAYTPVGHSYPPYLSLNVRNGKVELTIRSAEKDGAPGASAVIELDRATLAKFYDALRNEFVGPLARMTGGG